VVALRGDYSPEICTLFLAIVLHRRAVVGLPQGEDIGQHLGAAHAEALFDFTNPGRWSYMSLSPAPPPSVLRGLRDRGAAGLVVFTSGTTGQDKAPLFDFDALVNP